MKSKTNVVGAEGGEREEGGGLLKEGESKTGNRRVVVSPF
jgi:hypothetical protein